jgi:hypothetical protein
MQTKVNYSDKLLRLFEKWYMMCAEPKTLG